jgi:dihydroorotase
MKILIKNAKVIDANSSFNSKTIDLLIVDGSIQKVESNISDKEALLIESKNLCVSCGWVDLKANFCDPGMENKETIEIGLDTAAAGGYTHICTLPSTEPVVDGKALVDYQLRKAEDHTLQIHPIASITKKMKGEELSEMFDLYQSGVRLFSDDLNTVDSGIMQRALLYSRDFNAKIIAFCRDSSISVNGMVNEGLTSLNTGLKADPEIGEIIQVERNLRLLEYSGGALHLTGLSSEESVNLVRQAKKKGMNVTADVNVMNLCFTETEVLEFDTMMKVLPVLRTTKDQNALWKGIEDGTIDAIASDHRPMNQEDKELEFDNANFGASQLQTVFGALNSHSPKNLENIINCLSNKAREIAAIEKHPIEIGNKADLTLFDPHIEWSLDESNLISEYPYNPFFGKKIKGKIIGVINVGKASIQS